MIRLKLFATFMLLGIMMHPGFAQESKVYPGAEERTPSYPCNSWEYPVARAESLSSHLRSGCAVILLHMSTKN